jgi:hypothetical protein
LNAKQKDDLAGKELETRKKDTKHLPLASATPIYTSTSCFGRDTTAATRNTQEAMPHVVKTAVVTAEVGQLIVIV